MAAEDHLGVRLWSVPDPDEMFNVAYQIGEFAKAATVLRSYNRLYGLTRDEYAYESDGAHTNLMCALVDRALSFQYGPDVERTSDGYTYREIMEAARRHDLPENVTGDLPDNGSRDEDAKVRQEQEYFYRFSQKSPSRECDFEAKVKRLLFEMEQKSTSTGTLLFLADKVAALIITLCYDDLGNPPTRSISDPTISSRDKLEMEMCDISIDGAYFASEMWAIDFFEIRHFIDLDDDGWFTALIVMYTLQVKGSWYDWREQDYDN